jgi:hypothetical protein
MAWHHDLSSNLLSPNWFSTHERFKPGGERKFLTINFRHSPKNIPIPIIESRGAEKYRREVKRTELLEF